MAFLLNSQVQGVSGEMNNLPKHHGAGPQRRGAQCSCIGLRPALFVMPRPGRITIQLCFNYLARSFFKALDIAYTFPGRQKREMPRYLVQSSFAFMCMGMFTTVCQFLAPLLNTMPFDAHGLVKELLIQYVRQFRSDFTTFQFGFTNSRALAANWAAVMVFSSLKCM